LKRDVHHRCSVSNKPADRMKFGREEDRKGEEKRMKEGRDGMGRAGEGRAGMERRGGKADPYVSKP
jgi:hypothetical protein